MSRGLVAAVLLSTLFSLGRAIDISYELDLSNKQASDVTTITDAIAARTGVAVSAGKAPPLAPILTSAQGVHTSNQDGIPSGRTWTFGFGSKSPPTTIDYAARGNTILPDLTRDPATNVWNYEQNWLQVLSPTGDVSQEYPFSYVTSTPRQIANTPITASDSTVELFLGILRSGGQWNQPAPGQDYSSDVRPQTGPPDYNPSPDLEVYAMCRHKDGGFYWRKASGYASPSCYTDPDQTQSNYVTITGSPMLKHNDTYFIGYNIDITEGAGGGYDLWEAGTVTMTVSIGDTPTLKTFSSTMPANKAPPAPPSYFSTLLNLPLTAPSQDAYYAGKSIDFDAKSDYSTFYFGITPALNSNGAGAFAAWSTLVTPYPLPVTRTNTDDLTNTNNQWNYVMDVVNVNGITDMRIQLKFFLGGSTNNIRYDVADGSWKNYLWTENIDPPTFNINTEDNNWFNSKQGFAFAFELPTNQISGQTITFSLTNKANAFDRTLLSFTLPDSPP